MKVRLQILLLGVVLVGVLTLMVLVGREAFEPRVPFRTPGPAVHEYDGETLDRFGRLLEAPGWTAPEHPRNLRGLLTAVHGPSGLTFVLIPGGEFRMGSDRSGREDETPVRTVQIRPFLLSATECTERAWARSKRDDASGDLPARGLSWVLCTEWCGETDAPLRLPTEAEWEYACRAGSTGRWCFGDDPGQLSNYAWFQGNSDGEPHSVAGLLANAWGLYDMHGNVWEWCSDPWRPDLSRARDREAAVGPASFRRVYRGGSFLNIASNCRSANRSRDDADVEFRYLGFRPAADLPAP